MGVTTHSPNTMTVEDYIKREIELWGFDEIEVLLNDGFYPVMTDRGYKWLKTTSPVLAETSEVGLLPNNK